MTIPVMYLWPLGCLTLIGLVHAVFAIEEMIYRVLSK
jgi:hypothetical protein